MSDFRTFYGTPTPLTITLDGLPSSKIGVAQRSAAISNATDGWEDFEFTVILVPGAGELERLPSAQVLLYRSADNGTSWESEGNTNARVRVTGKEVTVGTIPIKAGITTSWTFKLSENARGNFIPPRDFGLIVTQASGRALGTGCSISYRGIRRQLITA